MPVEKIIFWITVMLVCYALENYSAWFILAFAVSCMLASVDGFLQGARLFGSVEGVWSVVAVHRWWLRQGRPLVYLIRELRKGGRKTFF